MMMDIVSQTQECVSQLQASLETLKVTKGRLESLSKSLSSLDGVETEVSQLIDLLKLKEVLEILQATSSLHQRMEQEMSSPTSSTKATKAIEADLRLMQAVDSFAELKGLSLKVFSMTPPGNSFREYMKTALMFWHEKLLTQLAPRFEQLCTTSGWPTIGFQSMTQSSSSTGKKVTVTSAFDNFFVALLKIEVRDVLDASKSTKTCLPIELMLKPLKKRFHYHFMGTTRTNQLEKPEWFLTQILAWVKDNSPFLEKNVDPLLRLQEKDWPCGKTQLAIGLLDLVYQKLRVDLDELVYDDKSYSHTLDEVLSFLRELDLLLGDDALFVHRSVDIFSLFLRPQFSTKLLSLEKKQASDYVDSILESSTAWSVLAPDLDEDDTRKVPEAADNFVLLLNSIIERCHYVFEKKHRQPFVDLIIELMDDFRLRLTQLTRSSLTEEESDRNSRWPFSNRFFAVMNALSFLKDVVHEWTFTPFFLECEESREAAIAETISHIQHQIQEMESRVVDAFSDELRIAASGLSSVKWFSISEDDNLVTGGECRFIHVLSTSLMLMKRSLSSILLESIMIHISSLVNRILMEDVILRSTFNDIGASRMKKLVCQHLTFVFKDYLDNPPSTFAQIREAVTVISWSKGVAQLFEEALLSGEPDSYLEDMGIHLLSLDFVRRLMSRRVYS